MRRFITLFFMGLLGLSALTGCTAPAMKASEQLDIEAKQFSPRPGKAALYIYIGKAPRSILAPVGVWTVSINGKKTGQIDLDTYLCAEIEMGTYTLDVPHALNVMPLELTVDQSKPYFISFDILWNSNLFIEESNIARGRSEVERRKAGHVFSKPRPDNRINVRVSY